MIFSYKFSYQNGHIYNKLVPWHKDRWLRPATCPSQLSTPPSERTSSIPAMTASRVDPNNWTPSTSGGAYILDRWSPHRTPLSDHTNPTHPGGPQHKCTQQGRWEKCEAPQSDAPPRVSPPPQLWISNPDQDPDPFGRTIRRWFPWPPPLCGSEGSIDSGE